MCFLSTPARGHEDGNPRYIKAGNQNALGDAHVDAIVQAYQERKEQDKFAHVATLEEIKENEYNLNIPRYVDTFEEEATIDLQQVQSNIALAENRDCRGLRSRWTPI